MSACVANVLVMVLYYAWVLFFFFNDTATTEIYTLSLHDALPIYAASPGRDARRALHWELRVEDDGCGLPSDPGPGPAQGAIPPGLQGMGLAGMHRRAHAIGAVLDILPRAGGGTVVRVRW